MPYNYQEKSLPRRPCPVCGRQHDSIAQIGDTKEICMPQDGDLTLCINCGSILIFANAKENIMVQAKPVDLAGLKEPLLIQLLRGQKFIKQRGPII